MILVYHKECGVIVSWLIMFWIVDQFHLSKIHAVVIGLQNLLELNDKKYFNFLMTSFVIVSLDILLQGEWRNLCDLMGFSVVGKTLLY